jgi:hypothetical protein
MKQNGTQNHILKFSLMFLLLCSTALSKAQADYDFANSIKVSGTGSPSNVMVGDVYRFLNVKPNVDALVTITDITGGISVSALDASTGYREALQPKLEVPANSSGYLEMSFQFVDHTNDLPVLMPEVPVTCIDVDGKKNNDGLAHPLNDFDQVNLGGGYVDYEVLGMELTMTRAGNWFNGRNVGGVDYAHCDTSAKKAMFTVVNEDITSFVIRVGADNQSTNSATRMRTVYFKKFRYANGVLAMSPLQNFIGSTNPNGANLQWEFQPSYQIASVELERSYNGQQFAPIYHEVEMPINNYVDDEKSSGTAFYRLKWTTQAGETGYSSTVFLKMPGRSEADGFKLYPNMVRDRTTLSVTSAASDNGTLQIFDFDGKMQQQVPVKLSAGANSISIEGMEKLAPGGYVAVLKTSSSTFTQKMIKQP